MRGYYQHSIEHRAIIIIMTDWSKKRCAFAVIEKHITIHWRKLDGEKVDYSSKYDGKNNRFIYFFIESYGWFDLQLTLAKTS